MGNTLRLELVFRWENAHSAHSGFLLAEEQWVCFGLEQWHGYLPRMLRRVLFACGRDIGKGRERHRHLRHARVLVVSCLGCGARILQQVETRSSQAKEVWE